METIITGISIVVVIGLPMLIGFFQDKRSESDRELREYHERSKRVIRKTQ